MSKTIEQTWHVLPDPQWEHRHPLHSFRYICTRPEWDYVEPSGHGEEWSFGFDDSDGKVICKLTDLRDQEAIANLISAAPDLLLACKLVASAAKMGDLVESGWILKAISNAISKAEGLPK